ncbi:hypothetical protein PJ15_1190 [Acinetobacter sp. neg1]|nr:hypothetical protein PJ15_1190 [Acinetobacter sp. neg1]
MADLAVEVTGIATFPLLSANAFALKSTSDLSLLLLVKTPPAEVCDIK